MSLCLNNKLMSQIIFIVTGFICAIFLLLIICFCVFHACLIFQGKTTKEKLTRRASKSTSKMLFCFIKDRANFRGGNQWLSKIQYEMYLAYCKEIREGRILEHPDDRITELFKEQRQLIEAVHLENMNKQNYEGPLWSSENESSILASKKDYAENPRRCAFEKDLLDSLKIRMNRQSTVNCKEDVKESNRGGVSDKIFRQETKDGLDPQRVSVNISDFCLNKHEADSYHSSSSNSFRVVVRRNTSKAIQKKSHSRASGHSGALSFTLSDNKVSSERSKSRAMVANLEVRSRSQSVIISQNPTNLMFDEIKNELVRSANRSVDLCHFETKNL